MEVQGKIKLIKDTQVRGAKGFRVRELVLTTNEQYPQSLLIQFTQDKTDLLDNFQVGQDVKISINLRGREWTNPKGEVVYFNSIDGWRIENLYQEQAPTAPAPQQSAGPQDTSAVPPGNEPDYPTNDNEVGDLPF